IEGEESLVFSEKMLTKIVDARVSEIFGEVAKELKKISKQGLLPAGIVLTGGGSKIPGILELTKKELKLPCRIGRPQNFSGIEDDPSFATVCGLVLNGVDLNASSGRSSGIKMPPAGEGIINKIKKFFKIFYEARHGAFSQ
ncbi:MAG: rod shape-determining protein, partial [Proteobacteria bacterium]|nr:rod shape-determining protein [Pseudomonadota bacterium]